MYVIKDLQFENRYFSGVFDTKREALQALVNYHSSDCNMGFANRLLVRDELDTLEEVMGCFEWELVRIKSSGIDKWKHICYRK